ncbi:MAG: thioredoxin domain-containing protein [Solirubrobacterales bacterium]
MSRAYNARRKARRKQVQPVGKPSGRSRSPWPRRITALIPAIAIIAILAAVAALSLGSSSSINRQQVRQEVTELLAGIPQRGPVLGSPKAPITIKMFGDLECPTVKHFIADYLPFMVETWVKDGMVKFEYQSLKTDTIDEHTFFKQEIAALAAGRQAKMWNFLLTFLHEQGQEYSGYVTGEFMADIASQVPGLKVRQWNHDREDVPLFNHVALGFHAAHEMGFSYTPSFLLTSNDEQNYEDERYGRTAVVRKEIEASLRRAMKALREETSRDAPALKTFR